MVEREVKAHRLVDHPNIMPLVDYEVVVKGENKEARLLFPYFKVYAISLFIKENYFTILSMLSIAQVENDIKSRINLMVH